MTNIIVGGKYFKNDCCLYRRLRCKIYFGERPSTFAEFLLRQSLTVTVLLLTPEKNNLFSAEDEKTPCHYIMH
jgi:hypothetical protein